MYTERYKEWEGFRRSWHCRKIQKFRFSHNAYLWSLVRNSVVLAVYLLFSVACFLTVHEHLYNELSNKDWFMTLLDLKSYIQAKDKAFHDYLNRQIGQKCL